MAAYSGNYCARWHDLLPLHALGNPLGEEAAELREHLEGCAACRRELDLLREAMALLPSALDPVTPAPALKERLMEQVRAESSGLGWGMVVPLAQAAPGRNRGPAAAPPQPARRGRGLPLALAASLLLSAGASFLAWREHRRAAAGRREVAALREAVRTAEDEAGQARQRLAAAEEADRALRARSVQFVALKPTPEGEAEGEGTGRILWDQDRGVWIFVGYLPPPPPDREYELWFLVQDGGKKEGAPQAVPAGMAHPGPGGDVEARVQVPGGLGAIRAAAVTLEQKGGAQQPTSPPLLVGEI